MGEEKSTIVLWGHCTYVTYGGPKVQWPQSTLFSLLRTLFFFSSPHPFSSSPHPFFSSPYPFFSLRTPAHPVPPPTRAHQSPSRATFSVVHSPSTGLVHPHCNRLLLLLSVPTVIKFQPGCLKGKPGCLKFKPRCRLSTFLKK